MFFRMTGSGRDLGREYRCIKPVEESHTDSHRSDQTGLYAWSCIRDVPEEKFPSILLVQIPNQDGECVLGPVQWSGTTNGKG